jgi:hypothetical protein
MRDIPFFKGKNSMKKYRVVFRGAVQIPAESLEQAQWAIENMLYNMYLVNNIDYRTGKYRLIASYQIETKKIKERVAEYEIEEREKLEKMKLKVDEKEWTIRVAKIAARFAAGFTDTQGALGYFALLYSGSIMADHYREEYVRLIQDTRIMQMAIDLSILFQPNLHERMLQLNSRARELEIGFNSLGAVSSAITYLSQDFL